MNKTEKLICLLLGGVLADAIGRQNVFFISAGVCIVTLLIFAPYYLRRAPMNGREQAK